MLCRWYWPRFGGRVNCFLISAEEYRQIIPYFSFLAVPPLDTLWAQKNVLWNHPFTGSAERRITSPSGREGRGIMS